MEIDVYIVVCGISFSGVGMLHNEGGVNCQPFL